MVPKESHKVVVTAEVMVELKVMVKEKFHAEIVEPVTHLDDVLPMERSVTIVVWDTTKHFADLVNSLIVDRMDKEEEHLNMKLSKMKARMTGHFP